MAKNQDVIKLGEKRFLSEAHKRCEKCGNEYEKDKNSSLNEWNNRKFCSPKCFHLSRKGKSAWNIGLTKETDERVKNMSQKLVGHKVSEQSLEKMRISAKKPKRIKSSIKNLPKTKGKTYEEIYGIDKTKRIKEKKSINMSGKNLGKSHSEETKEKIKLKNKGKHFSQKTEFKKGNNSLKFKDFEVEKMINMYVNEGLNVYKIAEIFNYNYNSIYKILKENGIKTNKRNGKLSWNIGLTKETDERVKKGAEKNRGKFVISKFKKGKKHPFFNNWSSLLPYDKNFNIKFKKFIRERDGCCMICNIGFEDLKLLKRRIHIHHINYDKQCSIPQNCISLCNSCHAKTQINREHWTKFFQSLLTEKYDYQYSENNEVIFNLNRKKQENG